MRERARRAGTAVAACALVACAASAQQADVRIQREPGPGVRVRLTWNDLGPAFTYDAWRSLSPVGIVGSGTLVGSTGDESIVDTPPGGLVFYDVVANGGPSCPDDAFEENDDLLSAPVLTDGWTDLYHCPGDDDWFTVHAVAGEGVRIGLSNDPSVVDLRLELYIDGMLAASDPSFMTVTASVSGPMVVAVRGDAAGEGPYRLHVASPWVTADCDVDYAAPNQTRATATPGWPEWSFWTWLTICERGEDWFIEDVPVGTTIYLWLDPLGNINYDWSDESWFIAELYAIDGTTLLARSDSREGVVEIEHVADSPGRHFLRVRGFISTVGEFENQYEYGVITW